MSWRLKYDDGSNFNLKEKRYENKSTTSNQGSEHKCFPFRPHEFYLSAKNKSESKRWWTTFVGSFEKIWLLLPNVLKSRSRSKYRLNLCINHTILHFIFKEFTKCCKYFVSVKNKWSKKLREGLEKTGSLN